MDRKGKEAFIADMKDRLGRAKATFILDYQGLDVESMNSLRGELRKDDIELKIIKNRLLKLASQETESASLSDYFKGPCALAMTYEDVVSPAKILVQQSKELKNLDVKVGQIAGKVLQFEDIKRLSELPGREVLLAQALSAMQAVPGSFVRALNGIILNLVYTLKSLEQKKAEDAS